MIFSLTLKLMRNEGYRVTWWKPLEMSLKPFFFFFFFFVRLVISSRNDLVTGYYPAETFIGIPLRCSVQKVLSDFSSKRFISGGYERIAAFKSESFRHHEHRTEPPAEKTWRLSEMHIMRPSFSITSHLTEAHTHTHTITHHHTRTPHPPVPGLDVHSEPRPHFCWLHQWSALKLRPLSGSFSGF